MLVKGFVGHGKQAYADFAKPKDVEFSKLWNDAYDAGMAAVEKAAVVPMVVSEANLDGSAKAGGKSWYVSDGVCGFAWVTVKPGNSAFANWGKKKGLFSKAYGGGVSYWVGEFDQSMQKKEAFARAVAAHLRAAGGLKNVWAASRMD